MKEIHVVGAAIIKGNRVLAAKRSEKMNSPLKWEFPGGKVEKNESHESALEREIKEELGVNIKVKDFIASGSSCFADNTIILYVYEAELLYGEPYPSEHAELTWIEMDHLEQLDWAKADIPACSVLGRKYKKIIK